ncbi:hypothetical protein J2I47_24595 [Fibrella sp. HMF5335]|uniref:Uncharacterized protein n=1 Tax=Fibrella rubiginis TaxID=2817060 RepID=A0A939GKW7_9BACT|nr:hypothetical protein [Fibrella rubiginis]MBO0939748.1 hypothetical protein [Fibrella rubiginis]
MIRILLLGTLVFTTMSCGRDTDIAPTMASEVTGRYQTNGFLDVLCVALPANKMPTATINIQSDAVVTLTYQQVYPTEQTHVIPNIALKRQADNSIQLSSGGSVVGTVSTDRVFSNNGMERQGLVLRIQAVSAGTRVSFTGSKE